MDPSRAIRLQRKVIDLQLASSDWAPAEASIDAYLAARDNIMINGGFPSQPGGVDASFVEGVTGDPLTQPPWFP